MTKVHICTRDQAAFAAQTMQVSRRSVFNARRLLRFNRPDLNARIAAGDLSIRCALAIADSEARAAIESAIETNAEFRAALFRAIDLDPAAEDPDRAAAPPSAGVFTDSRRDWLLLS